MSYYLSLWMSVALVLSGCATRHETFAVLPDADGQTGAITILPKGGGEAVVLDRPYAAAGAEGRRIVHVEMDRQTVHEQFSQALAAQPAPPEHPRRGRRHPCR